MNLPDNWDTMDHMERVEWMSPTFEKEVPTYEPMPGWDNMTVEQRMDWIEGGKKEPKETPWEQTDKLRRKIGGLSIIKGLVINLAQGIEGMESNAEIDTEDRAIISMMDYFMFELENVIERVEAFNELATGEAG